MAKTIKRNQNGDGSIRFRSDGRWEGRLTINYLNGKQIRKSVYGRTKKEVRLKLENIKKQMESGVRMDEQYSVSDWGKIWFENKKDTLRASTSESYKYTMRFVEEYIGKYMLPEVRTMDIESMLRSLKKQGYSTSQIEKVRAVAYAMFEKAVANDLIIKNPVAHADKISGKSTTEKEVCSADEYRLSMAALPYDKTGITIRLMLATGLRSEELLGLEPKGIEPDGSVIHIYQAAQRAGGKMLDEVGPPKNKFSVRDVPVPLMARKYAVELRNTSDRFIWQSQKGKAKPYDEEHFRRNCVEEIKTLIPDKHLTPHCFRHSYVTQLQAHGVDEMTISALVGHSKESMTNHYTHVQPETKRNAVEKLNDLWIDYKSQAS